MKNTAPRLAQAAENWQRCPHEALPRAFYAYNTELQQSERVVTYRLREAEAIAALTDRLARTEQPRFVIHLGLAGKKPRLVIPTVPAFQLFVQVLDGKAEGPEHYVQLEWVPNSQFGKRAAGSTESGPNAIPGASALLFAQAWRQLPYERLADPFTASLRELGRRVKAYVHSEPVSRSIQADLLGEGVKTLTVHLGAGLAVWEHPFAFRPVVEVGTNLGADGQQPYERDMSNPENGGPDGSSYYDFSVPEPPKHPTR